MINRVKIKEFHFVVNNSLKSKIKKISSLLNISISKTILFILEKNSALQSKIHLSGKDENCMVSKVDWDEHIHLYIPKKGKNIYHELKSIHKNNNTYSIAGSLRLLINVFIKGVELYGLGKYLVMLEREDRKWKNRIGQVRIWYKKMKVRQLSIKSAYSVHYAPNHTPILIKLLN